MLSLELIGVLLTAIFTGGILFLTWKNQQPIVEISGKQVSEDRYKCKLILRNNSNITAKITSIKALEPKSSHLCKLIDMGERQGDDILDINHSSPELLSVVEAEPKTSQEIFFFFISNSKNVKSLGISVNSSWSVLPIIKRQEENMVIKIH
jgi:hypothetical protein